MLYPFSIIAQFCEISVIYSVLQNEGFSKNKESGDFFILTK